MYFLFVLGFEGVDKADHAVEDVEEDVEEEDLMQTQTAAGQESDSRSAMSLHEEESSQDTNHTQPRRSSRAHKQTQRFAEMNDHDDDTMAAPTGNQHNHGSPAHSVIHTRRSSRRIENGVAEKDTPKVDPLTIRRKTDGGPEKRERITMKVRHCFSVPFNLCVLKCREVIL